MLYEDILYEEKKYFTERCYRGNGPLTHSLVRTESMGKYGVHNDYAGDDVYAVNEKHTIIHKYSDCVLILATKQCVKRCAYCFRQINLDFFEETDFYEFANSVLEYLKKHEEVEELILSGGDPITLGADKLQYLLAAIACNTKVNNFRLHTRSIVYAPDMISDEIIAVLKKYDVRLIFHIIHPYEIYDAVEEKIAKIHQMGIRCYNQFPILRNINDNVKILKNILDLLDRNRVRNLTMFIPDPLNTLEEYRVSIKRVAAMYDELEKTTRSWINATRCMFDSVQGKISIKNLLRIENNIAYFKKNDEIVEFPDIPDDVDIPGDLSKMLWRN